MSKTVVVNGTSYIVPEQGDNFQWGAGQGSTPGVTPLLQALGAETLQKTGGSFPLTNDVDFGSSHGVKASFFDIPGASMPASSTGRVRVRNYAGGLQVSQNAGGYEKIVKRIDPVSKGADPTGASDSTSALQNALDAAAASQAQAAGYAELAAASVEMVPGVYVLSDTVTINGRGIDFLGMGRRATAFVWNGPAGRPMFKIANAQHLTMKSLAFYGKVGARPSAFINSHYDAAGAAYTITANKFEDLHFNPAGTANAYDKGFQFDGVDANNSDCLFFNIDSHAPAVAHYSFENSQVRAHAFLHCNAYGGPRIVTTALGTGGYGGDYLWIGGNASSATRCAFEVGRPPDRIAIWGVTSEGCKRFFTGNWNPDDGAATPYNGTFPIDIRGCRISGDSCAADGYFITYVSSGQLVFESNQVDQGGGSYVPKIAINADAFSRPVIRGNTFKGFTGSYGAMPYTLLNAGQRVLPRCEDNTYTDVSGNVVLVAEELGVTGNANWQIARKDRGRYWFALDTSKLTAAATSQTIALPAFPPHTQVKSVRLLCYSGFQASGLSAITAKVGSSSGGNQYIVASDIFDVAKDQTVYGEASGDLGTALSGAVQGGAIGVPYTDTGKTLYLTLATTGANLGNGSVTNISRGSLYVIVEASAWDGVPY